MTISSMRLHIVLDVLEGQIVRRGVDQLEPGTIAAAWASQVGNQKLFTSRFIW